MSLEALSSAVRTQAVTAAATATKKTDSAAEAGEGFEKMLLGQLTKQLIDSAMPEGEQTSAATGTYKQMLPDALTEALMSGGGIGLAKQLADGKATS